MSLLKIRNLLFVPLLIILAGCSGGSKREPISQTEVSQSSVANSSVASNAIAASSISSTEKLPIVQQIDDYLATNQSADLAGISIIIVKDGKVFYSGGKGMADIASGISISSTTGFRLASVSKPFTAVAIMQLVERGDIKLSDSLLDYIPELPSTWRKITIEHLLTHTSGIYDIINDGWKPNVLNGLDHKGLIKYLINNPALEFEPGSQMDYSNTGYMLLATVIERKTGLSFSEHMQRNIFGPANMKGSYINDEHQPIKFGDALNYARLRTYYGITTNLKGSMAQVSSREDFFNFFEAMRNNTLISAQTFKAMTTSHGVFRGTNNQYGYGFGIGGDYFFHLGEWDGFETEMSINPKRGLEFAILTNSGPSGRVHIDSIRNMIFKASFD